MELFLIFLIGGAGYGALEILWRGYTHWTMLITGGVCFVLIYLISRLPEIPFLVRCAMCTAAITAVEFIVGYVVNIRLGWNIWDYSGMPLHVMGQICVPYMFLWYGISGIAIWINKMCDKVAQM